MRERYDLELNHLCQHLLALQASMLREQNRVERLLRDKDFEISKQKVELEKASNKPSNQHNNVSVTSLSANGTFGGSLRIHGSFRQYKKDREKIRHFKTNSGDSGINIGSSEESSSSPSTLPRTLQKQKSLRPVEFTLGTAEQESKANGLTHLQQLIEQKPMVQSTKIQISDTKSDSGRESDEPNISVVTVGSGSAPEAAASKKGEPLPDPSAGWKISVSGNEQKRVKPPPPPRSSQTKLSTVTGFTPKPKSILSPTSSLNTAELSPTEALDNLIRNVDNNRSKKRVKFNPKVDIDSAMKPIDPNAVLHFLPKMKQEADKTMSKGSERNFSYYEPYI